MLRLLGWFVIAIVLLPLLGVVALIRSTLDWRLWPAIRRARREIRNTARQRVPNAEVSIIQGATAISPGHLSFCIRTDTDKERDLLRQDPEIHKQFRNALVNAGYPTNTVPVVHLDIESQETVDREYGGSWHEPSEMP
jgi:hypothetical protein